MRTARAIGAVVAAAVLSGCGGSVTEASGDGGAAGAPSCELTSGRASLSIEPFGGEKLDCASQSWNKPSNPTVVVEGAIAELLQLTDGVSFAIDECSPAADCMPMLSRFTVKAPSLVAPMPIGAYVHVDYSLQRFFACQQSIVVTTLASWDGYPTPVGAGGMLLLAAVDGGGVPDGSPFDVATARLDCASDAGQGCGGGNAPGVYAFEFFASDVPTARTRVGMGQTAPLTLYPHGAPQQVLARNLRSYQTDACDDYWNWAYTLVPQPMAD